MSSKKRALTQDPIGSSKKAKTSNSQINKNGQSNGLNKATEQDSFDNVTEVEFTYETFTASYDLKILNGKKRRAWAWDHFDNYEVVGINRACPIKDTTRVKKQIVICKNTQCPYRILCHTGSTERMVKHLEKYHELKPDHTGNSENLVEATAEPQRQFKYLVLMFLITSGLAFRAVENKYFSELLEYVANNSINFTNPSRRSLKRLAKKNAAAAKEAVKKTLEEVSEVAITTDAWTSTKKKWDF